MKRIIASLTFATLVLASCNQKREIDFNVEIRKLDSLLKTIDESSQFFVFSADSIVTVTGKNGTIFKINPSDLITVSGKEINDSINIELKELRNQYQMAMANAQTVSNNKLLVSGGAYFIEITTKGEKVKLKPQKKIRIKFPSLSQDNMSLFLGKRDSIGQLNWISTNIDLINERERLWKLEMLQKKFINELRGTSNRDYGPRAKMIEIEFEKLRTELDKGLYPEVEFDNLEWINCDRFMDINTKTDLLVKFEQLEKINSAKIFLIFKDINSVMEEYYFSDNNENNTYVSFNDIPLGANVRLVAYTVLENKIFSYTYDITLKKDQILKLDLKETSSNEFKSLFKNN
jgi:hypothetical protein